MFKAAAQVLNQVLDSITNALRVQLTGSNLQLNNSKVTWANSAVAGTIVNVDVALPTGLPGNAEYLISITNPSTVTDIAVSVKNKFTNSDAAVRYPELTVLTIPKSSTDGYSFLAKGALLAEGLRLSLSNVTVLGVADGFSAYVHVRQV